MGVVARKAGSAKRLSPLALVVSVLVMLIFSTISLRAEEVKAEGPGPERPSPLQVLATAWENWPQSEHFKITLEYRNYTYFKDEWRGDERDSINEGRFRVEYDNSFRENMRVYFNALLQADDDDFTQGFLDLDDDDLKRNYLNFTEAFLDMYFPAFDLRLGKQIITWGKADVFSPTDNVTPTDYSNLLDDDEIGVIAANVNYYWDNWDLQLVGIPVFTPTRLPPRGTRFSLYPPDTPFPLENPELPPTTLENAEFGVRLKGTYRGWDFSVSYYDGIHDIPAPTLRFVEQPPLPFPVPVIVPVYHKFRAIGGDFATTFGKVGIHGEAAQFLFDGNTEDDRIQYVIGFDYTKSNILFDHDLFVIVEYVGEHVTQRGVGLEPPVSLDRVLIGAIAAKIQYKFSEFTMLQVRGAVDFKQDEQYYVQPELVHSFTDNLQAIVGVDVLGGPLDTFFGQFRGNDRMYVKLIYTF